MYTVIAVYTMAAVCTVAAVYFNLKGSETNSSGLNDSETQPFLEGALARRSSKRPNLASARRPDLAVLTRPF